jgi:ubiquitin-protein ligase/uncharacterized CHY-type Zn-finger protein
MFRIICTKCNHVINTHVDIKAFQDGQITACPNCRTDAFSDELVSPPKKEQVDKKPFICPHCKRRLLVPISYIGKKGTCSFCKSKVLISFPEETDQSNLSVISSNISEPSPPPPPLPLVDKVTEKIVVSFDNLPQTDSVFTDFDFTLADTPPSVPPQYRTESSRTPLSQAVAFDYPKPPEGVKLPMRQRRLYSDVKAVAESLSKSPYIKVQKIEGVPPDVYFIEYNIRGIEKVHNDRIVYRNQHTVAIYLTADYPRQAPQCKLLTPIFHPNFDPSHICIGDHWTAGERLIDLIVRIGEMITYQSYNVKSPLDGEAAMWADVNSYIFPIDNCDLAPVSY